ncbi:MAG TPA: hypothetical protein VG123_05690 [Streptosporangiaceae bacterium]|jgi:hypothetical protein|nr:hypothetical protein [Streptosporangiaceae bacterium]
MGDSTACRLCGLSRQMLCDHLELQRRFGQVRYADPPGPRSRRGSATHTQAWA